MQLSSSLVTKSTNSQTFQFDMSPFKGSFISSELLLKGIEHFKNVLFNMPEAIFKVTINLNKVNKDPNKMAIIFLTDISRPNMQ